MKIMKSLTDFLKNKWKFTFSWELSEELKKIYDTDHFKERKDGQGNLGFENKEVENMISIGEDLIVSYMLNHPEAVNNWKHQFGIFEYNKKYNTTLFVIFIIKRFDKTKFEFDIVGKTGDKYKGTDVRYAKNNVLNIEIINGRARTFENSK